MTENPYTNDILLDIVSERHRQDEKWGEQNHPSVDTVLLDRPGGCSAERMCEHFEVPNETRAKFLCDTADKNGQLTWSHIAVEELSEAISAPDDEQRLDELHQLAAVVVAWIENIKRRRA